VFTRPGPRDLNASRDRVAVETAGHGGEVVGKPDRRKGQIPLGGPAGQNARRRGGAGKTVSAQDVALGVTRATAYCVPPPPARDDKPADDGNGAQPPATPAPTAPPSSPTPDGRQKGPGTGPTRSRPTGTPGTVPAPARTSKRFTTYVFRGVAVANGRAGYVDALLVKGENPAGHAALGASPERVRILISPQTKITGPRGSAGFRALVKGSRLVATFKAPSGVEVDGLPAAHTIAVPAGRVASGGDVTPKQWNSTYDWAAGHGYSGWFSKTATPDVGRYGIATGHRGVPGFWIWLKGGGRYGPGYVEWVYRAPGRTRLLSSELTLGSTDKLFSHHCVEVGLRDSEGVRALKRYCSPPDPNAEATEGVPMHDEHQVAVSLRDPADVPLATELFVRVVFPDCKNPQSPGCRKYVPRHDPLVNGAMIRVPAVKMQLVDDDLPTVVASGPFRDLDGAYINGRESYGVSIDAEDGGSGIRRAYLAEIGGSEIVGQEAFCDVAHTTPSLGAALCPPVLGIAASVASTQFSEGLHRFSGGAVGYSGNTQNTAPWSVLVDRTAPTKASGFALAVDPDTREAVVTWVSGSDPALPDGATGSGRREDEARYRLDGGAWVGWFTTDGAGLAFQNAIAGQSVDVEVRSADKVGNLSAIGSATLTVPEFEGDALDVWDPINDPDHAATDRANALSRVPPAPAEGEEIQPCDASPAGEIDVDLITVCDDSVGVASAASVSADPIETPSAIGQMAIVHCDDPHHVLDFSFDIAASQTPMAGCLKRFGWYRKAAYVRTTYSERDPQTKVPKPIGISHEAFFTGVRVRWNSETVRVKTSVRLHDISPLVLSRGGMPKISIKVECLTPDVVGGCGTELSPARPFDPVDRKIEFQPDFQLHGISNARFRITATLSWSTAFTRPIYVDDLGGIPLTPWVRCTTISSVRGCALPDYSPTVAFTLSGNAAMVARHIRDAQQDGYLSELTRLQDPPLQRAKRTAACAGLVGAPVPPEIQVRSCDEYPFASSTEGGAGSSVRWVEARHNSSQGGTLSAFYKYQRVEAGTQFNVAIEP
jgi:Deoxyribonuclease NucA/NucB